MSILNAIRRQNGQPLAFQSGKTWLRQNSFITQGYLAYLVEFDHHDGNSLLTSRLTDGYGYTTKKSDLPSLAFYEPRLETAGNYDVSAFEPGQTIGEAVVNVGDVVARNEDGFFDSIITDGFDGRDIRIIRQPDEDTSLSKGRVVFTGTMEQVEASFNEFRLILKDKLDLLREDIQDTTYTGTTTDGTQKDAEGEDDLEGRIKPLAYGEVLNATALNVDRFNLIRQVANNALQDITDVYDRANQLVDTGTNVATLSNLYTESTNGITAAKYVTSNDIGMFALGAEADGTVTADVLEGASASDRTAAQIARRIITQNTDLTDNDLDLNSFDALDNKNSAPVGIYIGRQQTVLRAVSDVLRSIGAFITVTSLGKFAVYRLELPSASAKARQAFDESLILRDQDIERLPTGDQGNGVPTWKITLRYRRNWTVQNEDEIAGSALDCVSSQRKNFLTNEWRQLVKKDANIKTKHKRAPALEFDTLLVNESDAQTELDRRFAIYSTNQERYRFTVKAERAEDIRINDTIKLSFRNRFNLGAGKFFKVIGVSYDYQSDTKTLDVWGGVTPT